MPAEKRSQAQPDKAPPAVQSIAFVSLGCPKNLIDSEKMLGLLAEDGIAITPDHDQADAIVINTCGFLEASKTESIDIIREAIACKRNAAAQGRAKRVIVAGCLVQRHKAQLLNEVPEVDALVGVFDRENIVKAVRGGQYDHLPEAGRDMGGYHEVTSFIAKPTRATIGKGYVESDRARLRLTPRHYAYLRISEGCNQGCTFCTIPSIRGRMRSKPLGDILSEAEELIADGAFELNLIGQDTTSYGADIGYNAGGEGLSGMLRSLDRLVGKASPNGAGWVRLMYAYPSCFTDEMIKTLADCRHVVKYIDMPLQHINDEVLHTMRRKVTRGQIETLLEKLRKWVPGITLRTTFISGFPGETEAQHAELVGFVRDFGFENVGVFEFSPEPGTAAGRLHQEQAVAAEVAARRKEEIMLAQQEIVFARNAGLVGQTIEVLVDESNRRKKQAVGRHGGQAPDIDGHVLVRQCVAGPGELLTAKIEDYDGYDLVATPVETQRVAAERATKSKGRLSLPVVGVVSTSVETRGKGH
jgi:ribosomal protein S12 methylthiotransferase